MSGSGGLTVQFDTGGDEGGAPAYLVPGWGLLPGMLCAYARGETAISAVTNMMRRIVISFGCGPPLPEYKSARQYTPC